MKERARSRLRRLWIIGFAALVLALLARYHPVPCGPSWCGPTSVCMEIYGAGQQPPPGMGMPGSEYRCSPDVDLDDVDWLTRRLDVPRPAAPPNMSR